jgi:hypothetical protein
MLKFLAATIFFKNPRQVKKEEVFSVKVTYNQTENLIS